MLGRKTVEGVGYCCGVSTYMYLFRMSHRSWPRPCFFSEIHVVGDSSFPGTDSNVSIQNRVNEA